MNKYTVKQWCKIAGVEIVDNDGFRGLNLNEAPITLDIFTKGIMECTVVDTNQYQNAIIKALA